LDEKIIDFPGTRLLPSDASDEQILAVTDEWLRHVADGDFENAIQLTSQSTYYGWNAEFLRRWISNYGWDEPHPRGPFVVRFPSSQSDKPVYRHVMRSDGGKPLQAWRDVPLNGEWSDLVAHFGFHERNSDMTLVLENVIVP
jgi:hypothetical protein